MVSVPSIYRDLEFIWNQGRIETYGDAQVTDPETNRRFDRLEVKIDKLTEVLTNVARVEEKLIGTDARLKRHEFRLDEGEKKLEEVAELAASNANTAKIGTAVLASLWTAMLGYVAYLFRE